jgi:hypothetical protein
LKLGAWVVGVLGAVAATLLTAWAQLIPGAVPPTQSPSEVATASSSPRAGTPVKVARMKLVHSDDDEAWVTRDIVSAAAIAQLNRTVSAQTWSAEPDKAMRALGAVPTRSSVIEVELVGNRDVPVRIMEITALTRCEQPWSGTYFYRPGGGETEIVRVGFDLDHPNPRAKNIVDGQLLGSYFAEHKYRLDPGEHATFRLEPRTGDHYCEYRFKLDLLIGEDKEESQIIDDHGEPFKLSADLRNDHSFDEYQELYVTGVAPCSDQEVAWVKQDADTYPESCVDQ